MNSQLGRAVFAVLTCTQLALIVLVLPAYAAGTIAMEREKRTFDMIRVTLLSPSDVASGKLVAVMGFGVMLLAATLPIGAWCVPLGGITPGEVLLAYALLLAVALWAVALGVLLSAASRQSVSAVVRTYAVIMLLLAGLPLCHALAAQAAAYADVAEYVLLLAPFGVVAGWLLVVGARRFATRLCSGPGSPIVLVAAVVATVLAVTVIASQAEPAAAALSEGPMRLLTMVHPYLALLAILYPERMAELVSTVAPSAARYGDLQFRVWAVSAGAAAATGVGFWLLSVRVLRASVGTASD